MMKVKQHDGDAKIELPSVIDLTNAPEFKQALQSLYDQGCDIIYVDCRQLEMIDSAGIGSLAIYQKKLKERGSQLKVVNVNHHYIRHLFDMIELNRVISIEPAIQEG